jgi:biopolymer transport protein ExbD
MAATATDDHDELISAINVTPLVDVFLVLLVIFMVTANLFLEQERRLREIPLTLPVAAAGVPPEDRAPLSVLLDREGALYLDGARADLDEIGRAVDRRLARGSAPDVVVSADRDLPYGRVARAVDYLRQKGVGNLAINVEEASWPIEPR